MAVNLRGKSYLKLLDFTPAEIRYLLNLSKDFKSMKRSGVPHKYLDGKNIVLLFEKTPPAPAAPSRLQAGIWAWV